MRQQLELGMVVEYHLPFHLNMKFNNIPFQNSQTPKKKLSKHDKNCNRGPVQCGSSAGAARARDGGGRRKPGLGSVADLSPYSLHHLLSSWSTFLDHKHLGHNHLGHNYLVKLPNCQNCQK